MWEHLIDIKCNKKAIYFTINKEKKNNFFCYIFISFITKLFNKIYTQRSLPEQWLFAKITPVPKKGLKNNIENYRPITNLCSASKIFEKLILHLSRYAVAYTYIHDKYVHIPRYVFTMSFLYGCTSINEIDNKETKNRYIALFCQLYFRSWNRLRVVFNMQR